MVEIICLIVDVICSVVLTLPVYKDRIIVPVMSEEGTEYRLRKVSAMFRLQGSSVLYIGLGLIAVSIILALMGMFFKRYPFLRKAAAVASILVVAFTVILMLTAQARSTKY